MHHAKSVVGRIRFKTYLMLPCNTMTLKLQIADFCEEIFMSPSPMAMTTD
jgi:hypothetical protein